MATHPVLVRQLQAPLLSVLEEALASHRYALSLDQDNADTLFNTAQVLTSVAEETSKDNSGSDASAVGCLEEALELLQRCLALQEFRYTEFQEQAEEALRITEQAEVADLPMQEDLGAGASSDVGSEHEQWASIIEPVTKDILVDTAVAQLSTLTTLCGILGSSPEVLIIPSLAWIEEYSSKLLNLRLPTFTEGTARSAEVAIAKAVFLSALLEAGFRRGQIDVKTYRKERDAAFSEVAISDSSAALLANVSSLFAFNHAMAERENLTAESSDIGSLRWNALATAISNLATASKLPNISPEELPKTHALRGDASLYQYQLSKSPISYPPALKNSAALLKNAEVFYRNASRLTNDDEERDRSRVEEAIVMSMEGNVQGGREQLEAIAVARGEKWLRSHIDEVVGEGLLGDDDIEKVGLGW
jgi:tetratricopeptide (TPR) repeat protein